MHAMRLQKLSTVMDPQLRQRWRPAGVLHAALLLLCLALLMRASVSSAFARPVPSENHNVHSLVVPRQPEEPGVRSEEFVSTEQSPQPDIEATEDSLAQCESLPDATTEPCEGSFDRRILDDYGSPGLNKDIHPVGPLP